MTTKEAKPEKAKSLMCAVVKALPVGVYISLKIGWSASAGVRCMAVARQGMPKIPSRQTLVQRAPAMRQLQR